MGWFVFSCLIVFCVWFPEKKMRKIGEGNESRGDYCKEPVFLISHARTESWVVLKDANFSWK